jgi:hypothetical protein
MGQVQQVQVSGALDTEEPSEGDSDSDNSEGAESEEVSLHSSGNTDSDDVMDDDPASGDPSDDDEGF